MKDVTYHRIEVGKGRETRSGKVVLDGVVEVRVNDSKPFKMTMIPKNRLDAAIGRLFFMGLIGSMDDVQNVRESDSGVDFKISKKDISLFPVESELTVHHEVLALCMKRLFASTEVWELTGGVHSAGLFDIEGNLLYSADDIGKGNAIDAVIGKGLQSGLDFSKCILASTGRQIGFMIEKAVRAKIPIVVSRGAPLHSSIETAEKYGVTLVCFAKGKRMNLYTHKERIL
jgi:FdhD protein